MEPRRTPPVSERRAPVCGLTRLAKVAPRPIKVIEPFDTPRHHSTSTNFPRVSFSPAGTGLTVEFRSSNPGNSHARSNTFLHVSGNGGFTARGTPTYTTPSSRNQLLFIHKDNGSPDPTIETGAQLSWSTDEGMQSLIALNSVGIGASPASAVAARDQVTTESLRIINGSDNHVRITDGTREWVMRIVALNGNLEFTRISGGSVRLGTAVRLGAFTGSGDAAVNGYVTVMDDAGNVRKLATIA
jgi:hypothetical protein